MDRSWRTTQDRLIAVAPWFRADTVQPGRFRTSDQKSIDLCTDLARPLGGGGE